MSDIYLHSVATGSSDVVLLIVGASIAPPQGNLNFRLISIPDQIDSFTFLNASEVANNADGPAGPMTADFFQEAAV